MERNYNVLLDKSHKAYGKFSGSVKQPLFIVVHGLPCSITEGIYERACWWFSRHGYATYRFNLYSWQKDARQLIDCTLTTHASDLDAVMAHFIRKGFKKIYVAGHSFGGPTILLSKKQQFDAAVLWDPAYGISFTKKKFGVPGGKYVKGLDGYFMRWGVNVILSRQMVSQVDRIDWNALPRSFGRPLKLIAAGKGVLIPGCKKYFRQAYGSKDLQVLDGATHYFDDTPGMQDRLFAATHRWFCKH